MHYSCIIILLSNTGNTSELDYMLENFVYNMSQICDETWQIFVSPFHLCVSLSISCSEVSIFAQELYFMKCSWDNVMEKLKGTRLPTSQNNQVSVKKQKAFD